MSHAFKMILRIIQYRLQFYMGKDKADVQDGFRKGQGIWAMIADACQVMEKVNECQKEVTACSIDHKKAFSCVGHVKL